MNVIKICIYLNVDNRYFLNPEIKMNILIKEELYAFFKTFKNVFSLINSLYYI